MRATRVSSILSRGSWVCDTCKTQQTKLFEPRRHSSTIRKVRLPDSPVRTRFAPSPTGNLHLGSIRTALFNYLIAKRTGGQFLLRVEDTDRKRTSPGAEQRLYEDLRWAGLSWDEGPIVGGPYGPYKQSERLAIYQQYISTLIASKKAYRCFCSVERIDKFNRLRHDKGLPLGYDRKCADMPLTQAEEKAHNKEPYVIRFHTPKEYPRFEDLVYGKTGHGTEKGKKMQFDEPVYDDPVLIKSDGFPTYHFANVVDDQLMKITHVIRGSEWMASTPLHVALYQAFGWEPPSFGHVPLLVDHNRQKLSKRNLDMDIASYRETGYFPEALVNFAALLGWSHQQKSDVLGLKDLEDIFDLKFTKGNTIVSFDKLAYLQEQHAHRRVAEGGVDFEQMIRDVAVVMLNKYGAGKIAQFIGKRSLKDVIGSMLKAESIPYHSPDKFVERCSIFLDDVGVQPGFEIEDVSLLKSLRTAAAALCLIPQESWLKDVHRANLAMLEISPNTDTSAESKRIKKELYHYLRWALIGSRAGPSIPETMEILGSEICNARIKAAALVTKDIENMATKPTVSLGHTSAAIT